MDQKEPWSSINYFLGYKIDVETETYRDSNVMLCCNGHKKTGHASCHVGFCYWTFDHQPRVLLNHCCWCANQLCSHAGHCRVLTQEAWQTAGTTIPHPHPDADMHLLAAAPVLATQASSHSQVSINFMQFWTRPTSTYSDKTQCGQ